MVFRWGSLFQMPTLLQSSRFLALIGLPPFGDMHRAFAFLKSAILLIISATMYP